MPRKFFSQILASLTLLINLNGTTLQAVEPQQRRFFCGMVQEKFTTLVLTQQKIIPLIFWNSGYFADSGWTNQKRCLEVSRRFQRFNDGGKLDYIRTGIVNRYPVLCVGKCLTSEVLITLKPNTNPHQTLEELLSLRNRSRSLPLELSADQVLSYDSAGELFVNIDKLIAILEPVLDREVTAVDSPSPDFQNPLF
ncbi:hypothetical protein PCC7424_1641 [Gloeothece citriformis PCC 7424]|uniref:Uncharacterized protein n=1 Tax=Gloeothece citriformis (strain PCC 7424) TaxID=65393 RepID=B7KAW9_GLOC7|nr:COP23 domain-containing protein [Gloeothece citriformis]ACK70079.1 hypothetical protein PCC7424_1641 [Gloeothece citriformis PCC 7424]